jgi:hypothetical protein
MWPGNNPAQEIKMPVVLKQPAKLDDQVHIDIRIQAKLNVSAYMAQRQVTGYLVDNVSDHLSGETPDLVVDGERLLWRVPVVLYLTSRGRVGQVGAIDVDAQTGQLQITPALINEIENRARQVASSPTP